MRTSDSTASAATAASTRIASSSLGLAAGMFFGWLGVSSALLMMPGENISLHFSLDVAYTAGLIGVCLVAAVLASLLPGQKAASAPPTEALASD